MIEVLVKAYKSETTDSLVNVSGEDDRVQRQYHATRPVRHEMMYILFQKAQQIIVGLEVIQHQLPRKIYTMYIFNIPI